MADQFVQRGVSFKPEPILISELHVNTEVRGWLFVEEVLKRTTKKGSLYRQLKLRDQRGNQIMAMQFDLLHRETLEPQGGKVVLIEGLIEEYQNSTHIKLTRAELDESAPPDVFVVGTRGVKQLPRSQTNQDKSRFRRPESVQHSRRSFHIPGCYRLRCCPREDADWNVFPRDQR